MMTKKKRSLYICMQQLNMYTVNWDKNFNEMCYQLNLKRNLYISVLPQKVLLIDSLGGGYGQLTAKKKTNICYMYF